MDTNEILFLSLPIFLIVQAYTLKKFEGILRKFTLVSASIMVLVVVYTAYAFIQKSNLWPLILLFVSPLALVYQFLLLIIFKVLGNSKPSIEKTIK